MDAGTDDRNLRFSPLSEKSPHLNLILRQFIFSGPEQVWCALIKLTMSAELLRNAGVTITEALIGFILGTTIGASFGLSLWAHSSANSSQRNKVSAI
jgi:ABC-type nitrate/sulfonate/bicarbonate transport system permease component